MEDYDKQKAHNEDVFKEGIKIMRPDMYVLMNTLDDAKIDFMILVQVIYFLERIATGTRYGEVRLFIENGVVTFVRGEESKKLNLPIVKENNNP